MIGIPREVKWTKNELVWDGCGWRYKDVEKKGIAYEFVSLSGRQRTIFPGKYIGKEKNGKKYEWISWWAWTGKGGYWSDVTRIYNLKGIEYEFVDDGTKEKGKALETWCSMINNTPYWKGTLVFKKEKGPKETDNPVLHYLKPDGQEEKWDPPMEGDSRC